MAPGLLAVVAVGVAVAGIAYFTVGSERETPASHVVEAEWRTHEAGSFSVDVPPGWHVSNDDGRVVVGGDGTRVVIWPFFVDGALEASGAELVARRLAAKVDSGTGWQSATTHGSAVRLVGSDALAVLAYAPSSAGTAGELAVVTPRRFEATTVARILESFTPRGDPVAKAAAPQRETWTDPAEGAFSVKVPAGWSTTGGTERPSRLLVQASVASVSPDSELAVLMTDAIPLYVEPNNLLAAGGIYEGGTYVDPMGYRAPVRRYAPGATLVVDYLLPSHDPPVEVTRVENRPDLASQLATYGINTYDAGEVEYVFERDGVPHTGGALAITERVSIGGYSGWHVWRLFRAEAPTARYPEALAALRDLASSFRIDEHWAARQAETTRQQSGIITQMSSDVGETLSRGYWARQQVYDALSERRSKATLEVEDVTDDAGNTYRVESGPRYFWIDPQGTIVGTEAHTRPDVDFRELIGVR